MTTIVWAGAAFPDFDGEPRSDFGVAVESNRIVDRGPLAELRLRHPDDDEVGGSDLILIPGLINSHDHGRGLGTAPLGVPDDILETWLIGLRAQPGIDRYLAAAFDGLRLLRAGVCATTHSHNPLDRHRLAAESDDTLRGYRDAGIRVAYGPPIVDQNPLVYDDAAGFLAGLNPNLRASVEPLTRPNSVDPDLYFDLCADLVGRYQDPDSPTVQIQTNPVAVQWSSDPVVVRCVDFARRHQTRVQLHVLETRYQRAYAQRRWGKSVIRHLDDLGALGPWLTVAHMVWVDPEDFGLLAERGVGVAHNPSSNLRLRSGTAPVVAMRAAGIRVGVGLDGHSLDEDQDYLRELRLAWTLANRPGAASPTLSAIEIWTMGTRTGAAITFGTSAPLGALERGYLADLVLLDRGTGLDDWSIGLSAQPTPTEEKALLAEVMLRGASRRHVRHVMVNGRWAIREGRSTTLDERDIVSQLRANLRGQSGTDQTASLEVARALVPAVRAFYAGWDAAEGRE